MVIITTTMAPLVATAVGALVASVEVVVAVEVAV